MAPNAGYRELGNRLVFHTSLQKQNESEDAFAGRLKTLSLSCNFKGGKEVVESLIRDRFIAGLQNQSKQNMLLMQNPSLTIKQALEVISEPEVGSVQPHATRRSARQREGTEKSTIISILKSVKKPVIVLQRLPANIQGHINPDEVVKSEPTSFPSKARQEIPSNPYETKFTDILTIAPVSNTKPDLHISSQSTRENFTDWMDVDENPPADLIDKDQDEDYVLPVDDCVAFSSDSEASPPASPLQKAVELVFDDLVTDIEMGEETETKTTQFDEPEPVVVQPIRNHKSNPGPDQSEPSLPLDEVPKQQPTIAVTDISVSCAICSRTFDSNRTLLNHMRFSHNKEFNAKYESIDRIPCRFCDETFLHVKILVLHVQNVHQDEAKDSPPKCKQCRKVYPSEAILGWHLIRKHDTIPKNKGRVPEGKIIRCEDCTATFFHHHAFYKHLRMKHIHSFTDCPFKCDKCDDQFFIKKDLDAHKDKICLGNLPQEAIGDKETIICYKCGETTTNLQNHIRIEHSGKSFKCHYCELSFPSLRSRLAHKVDEHPNATISKGQRKARALALDGKNVVEDKIRAMTDRLVIDADKLSILDYPQLREAKFKCCNNKIYTELKDLHDHIYSKHRMSVGRNMKYFVLQESTAALEVTETGDTLQNKIYCTMLDYCSICNRHFKQRKNLILHNAAHHKDLIAEEDMMQCEYCESKFHGKYELERHRKAEHAETYTYMCNICDQAFRFEKGLIYHREQAHPSVSEKVSVKEINCDFCQESFIDTRTKLQHIEQCHEAQLADNSVQCNSCGNKFKHIMALNLHMSLKHGIKSSNSKGRAPDGVRFQCDHCDKSFKFISDLRKHERKNHLDQITSNPLVCQECDAKFVKQISLDSHMMKMHGMKRETGLTLCQECGKTVIHLDRHIETSHSEKKFPCDHCPKKFGSIGCVRKHIITVHPEKLKDDLYANRKKYMFQCPHCAHAPPTRNQLSTHLTNAHGYEKPYECNICHLRFSTAATLRAHKSGTNFIFYEII